MSYQRGLFAPVAAEYEQGELPMPTTIYVCEKCGATTTDPKADSWEVRRHPEAGWDVHPSHELIIRCPAHPKPAYDDLFGFPDEERGS